MHNRGQHIEMEDAKIVALYWDRNEEAIAASEDKYGAYCSTISYNITASLEDSEECVNETWLRAWNIIPPNKPLRLTAFFGKIVRNLSLDRLRRKNAMRRGGGNICLALEELEECIPAEHDVEQQVLVGELAQTINEFLKKLPERERKLFLRRYFYLEPVELAAKQLRISAKHAAVILYRVRGKLAQRLREEGYV